MKRLRLLFVIALSATSIGAQASITCKPGSDPKHATVLISSSDGSESRKVSMPSTKQAIALQVCSDMAVTLACEKETAPEFAPGGDEGDQEPAESKYLLMDYSLSHARFGEGIVRARADSESECYQDAMKLVESAVEATLENIDMLKSIELR